MKSRCSYISPEGQSLIVVARERGGTTDGDIRAISDRHQCKADAAWGIYRVGQDPRDPVLTCAEHVGRFLGTGEYRVVPIAGCPMLSIINTTAPGEPRSSGNITITTQDQRHHVDLVATVIMPLHGDIAIRAYSNTAQFRELKAIRDNRVIVAVRGSTVIAANAVMVSMTVDDAKREPGIRIDLEFKEIVTAVRIDEADRGKIKASGGTGAAPPNVVRNDAGVIVDRPYCDRRGDNLVTAWRCSKCGLARSVIHGPGLMMTHQACCGLPSTQIMLVDVGLRPSLPASPVPPPAPTVSSLVAQRAAADTVISLVAQRAAAEDRAVLAALCLVYGFSALMMERSEHHGSYIIMARLRDGTVEHCAEERIPILELNSATDVWDVSLHYLDRLALRLGVSRQSRQTVQAAVAAARYEMTVPRSRRSGGPAIKPSDWNDMDTSTRARTSPRACNEIQSAMDRKINDAAITAKVKI